MVFRVRSVLFIVSFNPIYNHYKDAKLTLSRREDYL